MACRNMEKAETAISELKSRSPSGTLSLLQLDVTSDASIAAAAKQVETEFHRLDVLVSNAGVASTSPDLHTRLRETFEANTFGPFLLSEAMVPLLKKSANPRIIHVSSATGSISLRLNKEASPTAYNFDAKPYRMSKSALNMLVACQHVQMKDWGCKVFAYCPGYVLSNLGGEKERASKIANGAQSPEVSAKGILETVEGKRDEHVGKFLRSTGGVFPW
jgi:NAD(P)-dependent dehydrogenase (short-subunit alcohol dehydrogenase family)